MSAAARVLLLTDPGMAVHRPPGHPERPERLEAVSLGVADGAVAGGAELLREAVVPAMPKLLHLVHPPGFVAALDAAAQRGGGWIDADTFLGAASMTAARLAVGATVQAAFAAVAGRAEVAFAVVRPPGHHATGEQAGGFCLLNNVAVAVAALREAGRVQRIAVLDWDVHHGNGTQRIFDEDAELCYASTHQAPFYPGTGDTAERGHGAAVGTKHNAPLAAGSGDEAFTAAWIDRLLPAVEAFGPEAILVSAGYDAHRHDPLAELEVTAEGYRLVAVALGALARRLKIPGVALTLEGGYDLDALRASAAATVSGLIDGLARSDAP